MPGTRQKLKNALDRVGLLGPAYAIRQGIKSARPSVLRGNLRTRLPHADEPPLPPLRLIYSVSGHFNREAFDFTGRDHTEDLTAAIRLADAQPGELGWMRLLDFGCGCGRLLRWWSRVEGLEIAATDPNPKVVAWCQRNLPYADVRRNELLPPLQYDDDRFDIISSFSVFTHLPIPAQRAWVDELARVVRPGGVIVVTTHGVGATRRFDAVHAQRLERDSVLVLHPGRAGSNHCAAYHTEDYMRTRFAPGLETIAHLPQAVRWSTQDITVYRRPS